MMISKPIEYLLWSAGGLIVSLGTVALSKHLSNKKGKRKIDDEGYRLVLKSIKAKADEVRPGNKHEADVLIERLLAFIKLHNREFSNKAKHFKPLENRLRYALSEDTKYTDKMKRIRKTCTEMLGRISEDE